VFDELFRRHVRAVYVLLGHEVPPEVLEPISQKKKLRFEHLPPSGILEPILDGRVSHFFEWQNAGVIVPRVMDYALQVEAPPYDPQKAKQLLAEAGYPNGFDAGDLVPIPPFFTVAESAVNYLNAVGIRVKMRMMERAAFYAAWKERKLPGLFITGSGGSGNAATRVEAFIYSKGAYAYGGYPDIDELFRQQAVERDKAKREAILHRIQELSMERVMYAPIMDFRALMGVGPRVAEHAINVLPVHPFPPLEEIRLK